MQDSHYLQEETWEFLFARENVAVYKTELIYTFYWSITSWLVEALINLTLFWEPWCE